MSLRTVDENFLLGDNLLIIPKWAKNSPIPKGNWRVVSINGEESKYDQFQADVLQKEGTIVPVGNLIQSTATYSTDSLTLLVSLNGSGKATGVLYEDANDGFGYKKGEYALWSFNAETKANVVSITITQTAGKYKPKNKLFKIKVISDSKVIESNWLTGNSLKVKI